MRRQLTALTVLLILSGCSYFQSIETREPAIPSSKTEGAANGTSAPRSTAAPQAQSILPKPPLIQSSDVEVFWSGDKKGIDGFLLEYGYEKDNLLLQKKIPHADLQTVEDPEYGNVFKALLPSVKSDREVFVVIRAYKGDFISPPSAPIAIPPLTLLEKSERK